MRTEIDVALGWVAGRWRHVAVPVSYLCSAVIFVGIVRASGPAHLAATFAGVSVPYLAGGAAAASLGWSLWTIKWQLVLRALGVRQPFGRLFHLTLAAQLWGFVLPAQVGGEIYRSGQLSARGVRVSTLASAAVIDRCATIIATALCGLFGAALLSRWSSNAQLIGGLALVVSVPIVGFTLMSRRRVRVAVFALTKRIIGVTLSRSIEEATSWLLARPKQLTLLLSLAIIAQGTFIVALTIWSRGFGVTLTVTQIALAMAGASLLPYLVPVPGTTAAIQQGTLAYMLGAMGAQTANASAVSLSWLVMALTFGILGLLLQGASSDGIRKLWPMFTPMWHPLGRRSVGTASEEPRPG